MVSTEQVLDTCSLLLFYEIIHLNRHQLHTATLLTPPVFPEGPWVLCQCRRCSSWALRAHTLFPGFWKYFFLVLMSLLLAFSCLHLLKPGAKYFFYLFWPKWSVNIIWLLGPPKSVFQFRYYNEYSGCLPSSYFPIFSSRNSMIFFFSYSYLQMHPRASGKLIRHQLQVGLLSVRRFPFSVPVTGPGTGVEGSVWRGGAGEFLFFHHLPTIPQPWNPRICFPPSHICMCSLSLCLEFYSPGLTDNSSFFLIILLNVDSSLIPALVLSPVQAVDNEELTICLLYLIVCSMRMRAVPFCLAQYSQS